MSLCFGIGKYLKIEFSLKARVEIMFFMRVTSVAESLQIADIVGTATC